MEGGQFGHAGGVGQMMSGHGDHAIQVRLRSHTLFRGLLRPLALLVRLLRSDCCETRLDAVSRQRAAQTFQAS